MIPQNVALVSFSDHIRHHVEKSLNRLDHLHLFKSIEGTEKCSMVLLHHSPPTASCLEWIPVLKKERPERPIIVIGDTSSPYDVAEAFRLGAGDFVFLPLNREAFQNAFFRLRLQVEEKLRLGWAHRFQLWCKSLLAKRPIVSASFQDPLYVDKTLAPRPDLEVQFFNNLALTFQGRPMPDLPGRRTKSLLAYLLHEHPKPVHREKLMDMFWGDSLPSSARNCLNVTLCMIRRYFDAFSEADADGNKLEVIVHDNERYGINKDLRLEKDTDLFDFYWKKGRQVEQSKGMKAATHIYHQAFAFYKGDFLEELRFEDWVIPYRERKREEWLVILDRLGNHFLENNQYQIAVNLCQRMMEKDPCLEDVHRRIMSCYFEMNMRDMALKQFQKCREVLEKELNVSPGQATWDLYLKMRDA